MKETVVKDDLDGTAGAEAHKLTLDDRTVTVDLADANYQKLADFLEPFFKAGTVKATGNGRAASDTAQARAWLKEHGHEINEKGRIPEDKMALYRARED
jgi:nucleoid-associated protein Lsr2